MAIKVRQYVIDPYGRPHKRIKSVKGELWSGEQDSNGVDMFENDNVQVSRATDSQDTFTATLNFKDGQFLLNEKPIESWRKSGYILTVV